MSFKQRLQTADSNDSEASRLTSDGDHHHPAAVAAGLPSTGNDLREPASRLSLRRTVRALLVLVSALAILTVVGSLYARHRIRAAVTDSLPQLDGAVTLPGLAAPVSVQRDTHGVPHIRAASLDDLVLAQGFVVASDRLFQMDTLRRHAAGELAEILGAALLPTRSPAAHAADTGCGRSRRGAASAGPASPARALRSGG